MKTRPACLWDISAIEWQLRKKAKRANLVDAITPRQIKRAALAAASSLAVLAAMPSAQAQSQTKVSAPRTIDVPAGPLGQSIVTISDLFGVPVVAPSRFVAGKRAPSISGSLTVQEALAQVLAGSGLKATTAGNGGIVIGQQVAQIGVQPELALQDQDKKAETIVITATRQPQPINEIARSVIVLDYPAIRTEIAKSSNIFNLVGALVPALGPPTQNDIDRAQTLRGRDPQYLIDGVPLSFNGGAGSGAGQLAKFDPEILGRVEVLYGPNAVYGAGATGGVIQFFTRQASEELIDVRLRQQLSFFPGADNIFNNLSRSMKTNVGASGTVDRFDYLVNFSFDSNNGIFDGEDDLRAPVFSGFEDELTYFAKLGFDISKTQRLEGFYNFVDQAPDNRVFDISLTEDGRAIAAVSANQLAFTYGSDNEPINKKRAWNLKYTNDALFGGALSLQYYGRDEDRVSTLIDLRNATLPAVFPDNYQSFFTDKGWGIRSQYSRTVVERVNVLVGVDYNTEERISDARVYDLGPNFDNERLVTNAIREDAFLFPFELETLGIFAQFDIRVLERLRLSGGIRWEDVSFEIGSGTRVFEIVTDESGNQISRQGGAGDNDGIAWNIGATYEFAEWLSGFVNFSQGFEIPSLINLSFLVPSGEPLATSEAAEPQIVDNYEIGLRGAYGIFDYSLAAYYARSELGATFIVAPGSMQGEFARSPQRNYGFELSAGVEPINDLRLSAAFSWNEGDFDADDDGDFNPLSGLEVAPWKFTFDVSYDVNDDLNLNGRVLTVGDRSRAFDQGTDPAPVEGYSVIDIGAFYTVGPGSLSFQITNLLNNTYIPTSNQTYVGTGFVDRIVGGPGRQVILAYEFTL